MILPFLRELYSPYATDDGLLCEIRTLGSAEHAADAPSPRFFGLGRLDRAAEYAAARCADHDVYMGVLPRSCKAAPGLGGLDGHVKTSTWLWCDVDRGGATDAEMTDFLRHVRARLPAPRMLVFSGSGGVHLYWRLAAPVTFADGGVEFSPLLRRLVLAVGPGPNGIHADKSCCNVSRILRVPGTRNHKHDPAAPVVGVLCDGWDALSVAQWDETLPWEPLTSARFGIQRAQRQAFHVTSQRDPKFSPVPPKLRAWAQQGYPEGNRHHDLVGAAAWLRRDTDLPEPVAFELFVTKAQNSVGRRQITDAEIERAWQWAG